MYNEKIEQLINAALADGVLTEKEKQVLFKRAQEQGIDLDEFEMVLDARLVELKKTTKSAPKSDKFGDVRKCPACGAVVPALSGSCVECGYEFSGVEASSASQKLSQKISEIKEKASSRKAEMMSEVKNRHLSDDAKVQHQLDIERIDKDTESQISSLINNYPIPNTKADLFDLMMFFKNQGYNKKYKECLNRASHLYPNDSHFTKIINDDKARKKRLLLRISSALLVAIMVPLCITFVKTSKINRFERHIESGSLDKAARVLSSMRFNPDVRDSKKYEYSLELIELYVYNNQVVKAIEVFEKITPEHCSAEDLDWGAMCHGVNKDYEIKATNAIVNGLIQIGDYDKAWGYYEKFTNELSSTMNTEDYYKFMSDVVYFLCKNGRKDEAKQFVTDYSVWFEKNVDIHKNTNNYQEYWKKYPYAKVKSTLQQIIKNY